MLSDLPPIDWRELGIDIRGRTSGNIKTLCPKCSHTRKHNGREPCLSVNLTTQRWLCHHCGWKGPEPGYATERGQVGSGRDWARFRNGGRVEDRPRPKREYRKPDPSVLPEAREEKAERRLYAFFAERGISRETVDAFNITTDGRAILFPYVRDGELVNVKHRWAAIDTRTGERRKRFRMEADAELILYNLDNCVGEDTVYIVEGEMDVLALAEAGITNVVSPPNGAPALNTDIANANFEYLLSGETLFAQASRVIVAGDMDEPGQRLMDELARRIGKEKCWKVRWPTGYKDANEVLADEVFGPEGVRAYLERAEPYPVDGLTEPKDYLDLLWRYEEDVEAGARLMAWAGFSDIVRISEGQLSIWTGVPSSGKSIWLNNLALHLAREHGWKIGLFSPEYHPPQLLVRDLVEAELHKPMNRKFDGHASREEVTAAVERITNHFRFILPPRPSLDEIMYRAEALVYREGIKLLIIDPWTEIDQSERGTMSMTDWVDICLKRLRRFGRNFDVHVAVVAHPKKMQPMVDREGHREWPVVTPYDISDSRHWYEMADVIGSVWRDKAMPGEPVQVHIQKVRFRDNGDLGVGMFRYHPLTHSYTDITHQVDKEEVQV